MLEGSKERQCLINWSFHLQIQGVPKNKQKDPNLCLTKTHNYN